MGERLAVNRIALGPMPTRTQQWRAPDRQCTGPICPAHSAAPPRLTVRLMPSRCKWRFSVSGCRRRTPQTTGVRQRPPATTAARECDVHHMVRSGAVWPTAAATCPQRGACRSRRHASARPGKEIRIIGSRIIEGMSKPRRRATQKARQARSSQMAHNALNTAGSAQRPSPRAPTAILDRIKRARSARDAAEAELDAIVGRAVDLGIGWPEIAAQLGVTRQAARQRYRRRHGSAEASVQGRRAGT